ncbi:MAG: AMP-binding protein [Rhodococcus sp. (in: high G+C Gram-positive bacteria)]|nr:AMP-binding protein [Rhodococcus sp. (in: high G+C Gram-positive bacteria)]
MSVTENSVVQSSIPPVEPLRLDGVVPYPEEFAERYRAEGIWIDRTFSEFLFDAIERSSGRIAFSSGDAHTTYAELGERILRLAAGLQHEGIERGDRVVVHLPNIVEFVSLVFALYEIGAVPVLAPVALRKHEIEYIVDTTGARGYITADSHDGYDLAALAAELVGSSASLRHTIIVARDGGGADLERLLAHGSVEHTRRSLPSDVAFLALSGGTTGRPKIVAHTHETYLASVRAAVSVAGVSESTVQLIVLPMSHSFAMRSPGFLGVLSVGGRVVLTPNGSPDVAFPLVAQHGVTHVALVPPLALAWLNSTRKDEHDLSSLEVVQVGGAKFGRESAIRIRSELGATLQQSFGMSEGLHTFTGLDEDDETITTRQGRPATSADEIKVVDDNGNEVPRGTSGNLWTRGPSTIRGYFRAPEHNSSFTPDGYYITGDIVTQDERGYLTVTGRTKDQINRGGEKIAPAEVEDLLLAHPAVHEVSVVGIPDDMLGERIKASILPRDGADRKELTLPRIRQFLRGRNLASYKMPDVVEVVDAFERTAVGKISKRS